MLTSISALTSFLGRTDTKPKPGEVEDPRATMALSEIVMDCEGSVGFRQIVEAQAYRRISNFRSLEGKKEDRSLNCKIIARLIDRFLRLVRVNWDMDQLMTSALDLMEQCPDWSLADVVNFLKYIRQNPSDNPKLKIYP